MSDVTSADGPGVDAEALDRFFVHLSRRLDEVGEDQIPAALSRLVLLLVGRLESFDGLEELVDRAVG